MANWNRRRRLDIIAALIFVFPGILSGQDVLFKVRVFQGTPVQGGALSIPAGVLSEMSYPRLAALKEKIGGTGSDLMFASVDVLLKTFELQAVDQIFSFGFYWDGKEARLSEGGILEHTAFRFEFEPEWQFENHLSVGFSLFKKKVEGIEKSGALEDKRVLDKLRYALHAARYRERMEKSFHMETPIQMDDPAVLVVPDND